MIFHFSPEILNIAERAQATSQGSANITDREVKEVGQTIKKVTEIAKNIGAKVTVAADFIAFKASLGPDSPPAVEAAGLFHLPDQWQVGPILIASSQGLQTGLWLNFYDDLLNDNVIYDVAAKVSPSMTFEVPGYKFPTTLPYYTTLPRL